MAPFGFFAPTLMREMIPGALQSDGGGSPDVLEVLRGQGGSRPIG
jgi:hypothetical protein